MNESRRRATLVLLTGTLFALVTFSATIAFLPSHPTQASGYYDPIAVGNWKYDQYDATIVQEAQVHDLDPFVIKGQILLESVFNPNALSPWGDQGLMQIKLATAESLGYTGTWSGLFDPWTNIHYGCLEMQKLLSMFGDLSLALQAYNIGAYGVQIGLRNWDYSNNVLNYAQQFRIEHTAIYGSGTTTTYTVQSGDTLYSIAMKFGVSWSSISQANNVYYPYVINVGQKLTIIVPATTYTVNSGDTLSSIAATYGVSWQSIAQANNIGWPYVIYSGESLKIP